MDTKKKIKRKAVMLKGGKCLLCGYSRSLWSLVFHHLNPFEKDIDISKCTSWDQAKKELEKCVLLCSNCHGEAEEGLIDPETIADLILDS